MCAEYDATALTLMRAIKAGVDPKGIMNPGTLLPLRDQEMLPRKSTIDIESLNDWIVKPKSLEEPMETDPQLSSIVNGNTSTGDPSLGSVVEKSSWGAWYSQAWNGVMKWGDGIMTAVLGTESTENAPQEVEPKEILEVWADQGDGV